jgi:hypothetical protein
MNDTHLPKGEEWVLKQLVRAESTLGSHQTQIDKVAHRFGDDASDDLGTVAAHDLETRRPIMKKPTDI